MRTVRYHRMMHEETAQRNRNCMLCNIPIKKKEKCYTAVVSGKTWPTRLHIHKYHCKPISIKNCKDRIKCITSEYTCNTILCKNRRSW